MSDSPKEPGSSSRPSSVTGSGVPLSIRWPNRYQPEDFLGKKAYVVIPRAETPATRAMRACIQTAKERLGFEESDLQSAVRILPLFIRYVTRWKFSLQKTDEAWYVSFLYYFNRTSSSLAMDPKEPRSPANSRPILSLSILTKTTKCQFIRCQSWRYKNKSQLVWDVYSYQPTYLDNRHLLLITQLYQRLLDARMEQ